MKNECSRCGAIAISGPRIIDLCEACKKEHEQRNPLWIWDQHDKLKRRLMWGLPIAFVIGFVVGVIV